MEQQKRVVDDDTLFSWIRINKKYFRTAPGITKIIQVVLGILCLILASPALHPSTLWFSYVVIIAIVVTVIWIFIYLLSAREAVSFPINWPLTETLNMCFMAIIVAIATIFQLSYWIGARQYQECVRNVIAGVEHVFVCGLRLASAGYKTMSASAEHIHHIGVHLGSHILLDVTVVAHYVLGIALCVFYLVAVGLSYIEWRQTHNISSS